VLTKTPHAKPETAMTTFKFTTFTAADSFRNRCEKIMMIVLGDDGLFWVVTPAHGEKLTRQGYEYAD
jgi:hypothetical protein